MMMRLKHISLYLACMIILLHAVVPHHHHSDKPVCFQELFQQFSHNHHKCCETENHNNHNHDFDKGNCIIDDLFAPKKETLTQTLTLTQTPTFDLFVITLIFDFILDDEVEIFRRNNLTYNYKNPLAISNVGLRAPPTC